MKNPVILFFSLLFLAASCVPARLHNELKAKNEACQQENENLKAAQLQLNTRQGDLLSQLEDLKERISRLQNDTANTTCAYFRFPTIS